MSDEHEHTHDWLNEREAADDRPSRSEVEEYRGTIPPYDQPPCDEDEEELDWDEVRAAAERVGHITLDPEDWGKLAVVSEDDHPF